MIEYTQLWKQYIKLGIETRQLTVDEECIPAKWFQKSEERMVYLSQCVVNSNYVWLQKDHSIEDEFGYCLCVHTTK